MDKNDLTKRLREGRDGLDAVLPVIYEELHRLARHHLSRAGQTPTLQPTALVNEAYMRLADAESQGFVNRHQFFAFASSVIRNILVDHIRSRQSGKRGGDSLRIDAEALDDLAPDQGMTPDMVLAVHEALGRLEEVDARQARIVEMHFFAGMRQPEIAEALDISLPTVERHWSLGRRRLAIYLGKGGG